MLKEKISPFIDEIRSIEGVEPYALISLDGIMPGNILTGNLMSHGLRAFSATILASSESIGGIVNMRSLESVAISAQDTSVMIAGAGKKFLIAAILKDRVDPQKVHNQMLAVGKTIGEVM
jgi:predicted regulator of Ras-like GTPase activity (Roadblock/LC7/MglB family)